MNSMNMHAALDLTPRAARAAERPRENARTIRVGLRSMPYLADHGFQDMVVLPGAFYIGMALRIEKEQYGRVRSTVRNITFHNPVILSVEDSVIEVEINELDGCLEYQFYEGEAGNRSERSRARQYAARLEMDRAHPAPAVAAQPEFSIDDFRARSDAGISADRFYQALRENGNQYGPAFQKVCAFWRAGDESLAKLSVAARGPENEPQGMHPSVLDSMTQLLAPLVTEKGKTFVLRSIDRIDVIDDDFPDTLWGHAALPPEHPGGGKRLAGNVRLFDGAGKPYVELSGVSFALLDCAEAAPEPAAAKLVIASNLTADPVEESLKFWGHHFGVPLDVHFAPYDQVLQQLLDPASDFHRNRDGINVVLLALEQWARGNPHGAMTLGKERAEQCFGHRARHVLPNGLEIAHLNRYETDYVYKEIFEDECYLRHGIRLRDGATVVDIGANIGLFSLFVMSRCRDPKIYAFEPAPVLHDLLKANCEAYGPGANALNLGVADKPKTAALTFYENSSVFSSFHADESEDRAAIQAIVRNMIRSEAAVEGDAVDQYVDELTANRLRGHVHECRMTTVSDIIRDHGIERIDLLKIDAEKSELDIISGIAESDWPKIDQIVIEIHDRTGETVGRIQQWLTGKGYRCAIEHEKLLEHSGLFNLYASRIGLDAARDGATSRDTRAARLQRNIDDFCAALGSFMSQARVPLILGLCPGTPAAQDTALKPLLDDAEQKLLARAGAIPNVQTIGSAAPLQWYPVADYYDAHGHQLGHVPYTAECYAAIGTALFRRVASLKRSPFKVIVLDCDNTLWKGVCGEDGPLGIELSAPYRELQERMLAQMRAGMLLCLCSKNNEKDVLEVFERRSDMVLKREHLVSWRINWNSKSENIQSLAKELQLGLDSFVFIDDNPVECAEVQASCPGVLTLQLPAATDSFEAFLDHVWAFDHSGATSEDQQRTKLYRENSERHRFQEQAYSLKDFIEGLQLRVQIAAATEDQVGRISQLTYRTNQFNFTALRRPEAEIRACLNREDAACLAVRVTDRFGDYGLVGAVIYAIEADRYKVDTLLLSCRVLGRGVEHAILSWLGQRAIAAGKGLIELAFRPTEKNAPAREFLASVRHACQEEDGASWIFPAERLAGLEYDPAATGRSAPEAAAEPDTDTAPAQQPRSAFAALSRARPLRLIAESLCRTDMLARAIEGYRLAAALQLPSAASGTAPGNTLEAELLDIWRKVLARPQIGLNDNFFEAGGTSLRAVQVVAAIKKKLNRNLSIVSLFESPTVKLLAARLTDVPGNPSGAAAAAGAALRGQQRRAGMVRRHAS